MDAGGNFFTARTICHNHLGEGSRKLYYYDNTKLFQCYTDCAGSFDIYELICKVKTISGEYKIYFGREGAVCSANLKFGCDAAVSRRLRDGGFSSSVENFSTKNCTPSLIRLRLRLSHLPPGGRLMCGRKGDNYGISNQFPRRDGGGGCCAG